MFPSNSINVMNKEITVVEFEVILFQSMIHGMSHPDHWIREHVVDALARYAGWTCYWQLNYLRQKLQ